MTDGKQAVQPNLYNEVGKLRVEVAALKKVIADLVAEDIYYNFEDNDRRFKARGFIIGKIREQMDPKTDEVIHMADVICFHPRWSGGMQQIDDVPMGQKHGNWWPRLMMDEALQAAKDQIHERAKAKAEQAAKDEKEPVINGTSGTRRTAATR